jgi:hypothetical protein
MNDQKLIHSLVDDLKPVQRLPSIAVRMTIWLVASLFVGALEFLAVSRFRPDALEMLRLQPRFALETLLIILSPIFAAVGAVVLSVPGNERRRWLQWAALFCFLGFMGLTLYDLWNPIFENAVHRYRGNCIMDVPLLGFIPLIPLFYLVKQAAPMDWKWLSILITLGAFAPLVAMMQMSCMAGAAHNLVGHILPVFVMGLVVLFLSHKYLKK